MIDLEVLATAWQSAAYSFGVAEAGGEPEDAEKWQRKADQAREAFKKALGAHDAEVWDAAVRSAYLEETGSHFGIKHDKNPYRKRTKND